MAVNYHDKKFYNIGPRSDLWLSPLWNTCFFVTYESALKARMLHNIRLQMLYNVRHLNLLAQFVVCKHRNLICIECSLGVSSHFGCEACGAIIRCKKWCSIGIYLIFSAGLCGLILFNNLYMQFSP